MPKYVPKSQRKETGEKISVQQVQASDDFIAIIKYAKTRGYRCWVHGGMAKRGWSKSDVDLYIDGLTLTESQSLPHVIKTRNGTINVSYTLVLTEPNFEV